MSGEMIKTVLEDVADNLFNPDPYYQQGGDMVRVGGLTYTCTPGEKMGSAHQRHAPERQAHRGRQDLQGGRLGAGGRRGRQGRQQAGVGVVETWLKPDRRPPGRPRSWASSNPGLAPASTRRSWWALALGNPGEITLKNRNLKKEQFIQEAEFTPSGVVRLAKLQKQGAAYIKP
jgi:hypothetical protein